LVGGSGTIFAGAVTHFIVAGFWGAVFASLIRREARTDAAFFGGLLYGVVVWSVMTFIVAPIVDPTLFARVQLTSGWWFYEHLIYGACLCVAPGLRREFATIPAVTRAPEQPRVPASA
jgi:hypothetical protein